MRTPTILLTMAVVAVLSSSAAAAGYVNLYPATAGGWEPICNLVKQDAGFVEVAVVVSPAPVDPLIGIEGIYLVSEVPWVPLSVTSQHLLVGDWNLMSVAFGACTSEPVKAATITFVTIANAPCGRMWMASSNPAFMMLRCDQVSVDGSNYAMYVNGVYDVPPGGLDPDCFCLTVGAEETTWGRVKALYRR